MRILITGGCGFVGHHMTEHFIKNTDWEVVILDRLSYAAKGFDRLRDIQCFDQKRVHILTSDFSHPLSEGIKEEIGDLDYIFHLGAETHVDRSIENAEPFVTSNVLGTVRLLEFAREQKNLKKFFYFSTDEVFGPAPGNTAYPEWDRYNSGNPYAASKAAGEEFCLAFGNTHKVPIVITHCMNIFGERQHSEKFIPLVIKKCLSGDKVFIHANQERTISGSRFWIHARNVSAAILFLIDRAETQEKYNIVGEREVNNLDLAQFIAKVVGKPLNYELIDFHSSRPGHDLRYGLDGERMANLGWHIPMSSEESLTKTIQWTLKNKKWLDLMDGQK
jgi:dTDP-glucose 4,6-dehydratase